MIGGWESKVRRVPNFDTPHLRMLVIGRSDGAEREPGEVIKGAKILEIRLVHPIIASFWGWDSRGLKAPKIDTPPLATWL